MTAQPNRPKNVPGYQRVGQHSPWWPHLQPPRQMDTTTIYTTQTSTKRLWITTTITTIAGTITVVTVVVLEVEVVVAVVTICTLINISCNITAANETTTTYISAAMTFICKHNIRQMETVIVVVLLYLSRSVTEIRTQKGTCHIFANIILLLLKITISM